MGEPWADVGSERTDRALADMRAVLERLEARLLAEPDPLATADAADLIRSLDGLTVRLARQEATARGRAEDLARAVAALTARLEAEAAAHAAREAQLAEGQAQIAARLEVALAAPARPAGDPGPLKAVLVASAALAALAVTGAGVSLLSLPEAARPALAGRIALPPALDLRPMLRGSRDPQVAAAPLAPPATTGAPAGAAAPRDSFAAVVAALQRGEVTAMPRLTGLAQSGDAEAQLHLASLYETGRAGLPQDLAAARLWTRRAAGGGNRLAMHNLGLFLSEGDGGPRDVVEAAAWFRRAADRGVVDSQFNLGLLYEAGSGVPRNLREAYRWFSIAANAGDMAAREKQIEVEGRLSGSERAGLDRDAAAFQPGSQPLRDPDLMIPPATTLAETQALLARQGYYVGPIDGVASPQFRAAAAAYIRDHPQVETGP